MRGKTTLVDEYLARVGDELEAFDTSKGAIRFPPDRPLPAA